MGRCENKYVEKSNISHQMLEIRHGASIFNTTHPLGTEQDISKLENYRTEHEVGACLEGDSGRTALLEGIVNQL